MPEFAPRPPLNESSRILDQELAYLGAVVSQAARRQDLDTAVQSHVELTGLANPNSVPAEGSKGLSVGVAEIPMSSEHVYRQVHAEAIGDLATSGVVRNPVTAGVKQQTRWGHRVFWNSGETGKNTQLGGRLVIEADKAAARTSWVTAKDVRRVYARDSDGQIKNILPN